MLWKILRNPKHPKSYIYYSYLSWFSNYDYNEESIAIQWMVYFIFIRCTFCDRKSIITFSVAKFVNRRLSLVTLVGTFKSIC